MAMLDLSTSVYGRIDVGNEGKAFAKGELEEELSNGKTWRDQPDQMEFPRNI